MTLDHLILAVNDVDVSLHFYLDVLGLESAGRDGPFTVVRVSPELTLLLSGHGTDGGQHLAFAMDEAEFQEIFARVRKAGLPYGDAFDSVGSMNGPGPEVGARGMGTALYLFDPNKHLIEIRHYAQ